MTEEWLEPWRRVSDEQQRLNLEAELEKEICEGHVLSGLPRHVLAKRDDQDDVLVSLENGENGRVAEVHLTWSSSKEMDTRWPRTLLFNSIGEWRIARMKSMYEESDSA